MPDTGDYGHGHRDPALPADWAGAFACLPQETPAADGWQRLQARLPAKPAHRHARWPLWLATAATLALAVAIPLRMRPPPTTDPSPASASPDPVALPPTIDAGAEVASVAIVPDSVETAQAAASSAKPASTPTPATTARARKPGVDRHVEPSQLPVRTAAQPADTTRVASTDAAAADAGLEALYAQSARLEGVLALARDDSVSSGTAAALTDTLDAQVAGIDAALAQPDLDPQRRGELWRERVDTLRQLVGIESTQRLYAARGQQYQAALVSID
jgi:hypothetical protein